MKNKYLGLEAAAMFINPQYKARSIYGAMQAHIDKGNFKAYFPNLAIVDDAGQVVQEVGNSTKPFFLVSELKTYKEQKKMNVQNGNQKKVVVIYNGEEKKYNSITQAAKEVGVGYHQFYSALKAEKEINGHKISLI